MVARKGALAAAVLCALAVAAGGPAAAAAAAAVEAEGGCDDALDADGSCAADASADASADREGRRAPRRRAAECEDAERECAHWASLGECGNNPAYMLVNCQISCGSCPESIDLSDEEEELLDAVEEYGKPQTVEGPDAPKTMEVIRNTVAYMRNDVHGPNPTLALSAEVLAECTNREGLCSFWAAIGECEANKAYMPALLPGELNAMFERIVATAPGNRTHEGDFELEDGMTNYTVRVHSRPEPLEEGEEPVSRERDLEQPPWIVTFENFTTEEECKRLIELGYNSGYKRSEDVGPLNVDGSWESVESLRRTSENAWCSHKTGCRGDTIVQQIHDRIAKVTGVPPDNSEELQVLKYTVGQFYRQHHDFIGLQRDRRCGPRILTFFLYLSDVEEGGATNFPDLGIAVKPKVGRALLWPSVLNSNPKDKEPRTDHEAQDVIRGTKYGANAWLHLHNYTAAEEISCT